jgi:hypothetical protein
MKSVLSILMIAVLTGLASCGEGPVGPQGDRGPQGEQGPKGDSGYVFEYESVNFTAPDYEVYLPFPNDFVSLNSDVALVYMLWDVVEIDGVDTEVWRQIPQSILTENGLLQYNFDFTMADVRLFMDAEFDLSILGAIDTDDWVVRVVIVPGDFWNSSRLSAGELEYNDLKEMLGLPELDVPSKVVERRE